MPDAQIIAKMHAQYPKAYPDGNWEPGFEVQEAIGEGQDLVTPLQLDDAYAAFANGGTLYVPQVGPGRRGARPQRPGQREDPQALLPAGEGPRDHALGLRPRRAMLAGFEGVTASTDGTAYTAFQSFPLSEYPVAGKTGTAQVDSYCSTATGAGPVT